MIKNLKLNILATTAVCCFLVGQAQAMIPVVDVGVIGQSATTLISSGIPGIANAISTIKTAQKQLSSLGSVKSSIFAVLEKVEGVKEKVEEVKGKIEEAKEKVEEVKDKVEDAKGKIEEAKEKVEEVKDKVEGAKGKIEEAKEKVVEEAKGKVEEIKDKVEDAKEKVEDAKGKIEETKDKLDGLADKSEEKAGANTLITESVQPLIEEQKREVENVIKDNTEKQNPAHTLREITLPDPQTVTLPQLKTDNAQGVLNTEMAPMKVDMAVENKQETHSLIKEKQLPTEQIKLIESNVETQGKTFGPQRKGFGLKDTKNMSYNSVTSFAYASTSETTNKENDILIGPKVQHYGAGCQDVKYEEPDTISANMQKCMEDVASLGVATINSIAQSFLSEAIAESILIKAKVLNETNAKIAELDEIVAEEDSAIDMAVPSSGSEEASEDGDGGEDTTSAVLRSIVEMDKINTELLGNLLKLYATTNIVNGLENFRVSSNGETTLVDDEKTKE